MVIREAYLSKIRPLIGKNVIKVLTGVRRGGKSVLLEQICNETNCPNTIFLNFEDLGNQHLCEYNEEATINREFGSLLEIKDNYPKFVLYKESSFTGNFEGIPAVKIKDWLCDN